MAAIEEPQFTSLSERIAALKQQGLGQNGGSSNGVSFNRRPPPPLPTTTNRDRPQPPQRAQTSNNPPVTSYGTVATERANNEPMGTNRQVILPPPPIDRDQVRESRPLPARDPAPLMPPRRPSHPSPALPPRKPSSQMVRRDSNSSLQSNFSTISGNSLNQSVTSTSSIDTQRRLPPAFDPASLPPVPPLRKEPGLNTQPAKTPLVSSKSAPSVPVRPPPSNDREIPPKMPPRPHAQQLPTRSISNKLIQDQDSPTQPPRKLPPPSNARNILEMGFNNKPNPVVKSPVQPTRPMESRPRGAAVKVLTDRNFDSIVMSGKPTLVDFYAPYCKYCKDIEQVWVQLGEDFAFASDKFIIAKCDVDAYKSFMNRFDIQGYPTIMFFDGHSETPQKYKYMRDREALTRYIEEKTGLSADAVHAQPVPPPINLSSKPKMPDINTAQSFPNPPGCLLCRDFSAPDHIASQYPRHTLPRTGDMTAYLASVLCDPFPSLTDKAYAIFKWLHFNVAYDTAAFFGNRVKHVNPAETITSGLAVCGGYAGLFCAIALKAGLEAIQITGHGKGYGYQALRAGEPVPPRNATGHAWNAVRIDGGEWKLVEPCWGAGYVSDQAYVKKFNVGYFTMSNDEFGLKHFPDDERYFFRSDGHVPSWEEYYAGPTGEEPVLLYNAAADEGLSSTSVEPAAKLIRVDRNKVVRFQFSKICEHWDFERNGKGKPYCMVLKIEGMDGKGDLVPFDRNELWWWCDVRLEDLGKKGDVVTAMTITMFDGRDGRGLTKAEFERKKGKCGMSFAGICQWELA